MSKRNMSKLSPLPKGRMKKVNYFQKNAPHKNRQERINELAANLFLAVWNNDESFDKMLNRIEKDKHVPPQFKIDVYEKVIASLDGFVQRFTGQHTVNKEEVIEWLTKADSK